MTRSWFPVVVLTLLLGFARTARGDDAGSTDAGAGDAGVHDCAVCQPDDGLGSACVNDSTCGDAAVCAVMGGGGETAVAPDGGLASAYYSIMGCQVPDLGSTGYGYDYPPVNPGCAMEIAPLQRGSSVAGVSVASILLVGVVLWRRRRAT